MSVPPLGFLVELEALPGKESAVADFLREAKVLVDDEPGTLLWFAFQRGPTSFGIFDVFGSAADRDTHLNGEVRKALQARGPELLSATPVITPVDIVAAKLP
jgi:quinol monooxygenase YgiN